MLFKKKELTDYQALAKVTLEKWLTIKRLILKAYGEAPIEPGDEAEFLDAKSVIAKGARVLSEKMKPLEFTGEKISALLRQTTTVAQLRSLPAADRKNLFKEWHMIFLQLCRLQGALEMLGEGWTHVSAGAAAATSAAGIKSGGAQKQSGKGKIIAIVVIVLAALAAAAYFLTQ